MAEKIYNDFENLLDQGYQFSEGDLREMDMSSARSVEAALLEFGPLMEGKLNLQYEDRGDTAEFSYNLSRVDFNQGDLVPDHYE